MISSCVHVTLCFAVLHHWLVGWLVGWFVGWLVESTYFSQLDYVECLVELVVLQVDLY